MEDPEPDGLQQAASVPEERDGEEQRASAFGDRGEPRDAPDHGTDAAQVRRPGGGLDENAVTQTRAATDEQEQQQRRSGHEAEATDLDQHEQECVPEIAPMGRRIDDDEPGHADGRRRREQRVNDRRPAPVGRRDRQRKDRGTERDQRGKAADEDRRRRRRPSDRLRRPDDIVLRPDDLDPEATITDPLPATPGCASHPTSLATRTRPTCSGPGITKTRAHARALASCRGFVAVWPLDLLEFALDGFLAVGGAVGAAGAVGLVRTGSGRTGTTLARGIESTALVAGSRRSSVGSGANTGQRLGKRLSSGLDRVEVVALERLAQRGDLVSPLPLVLGRDLVAEVLERPLGLVGQLLRLVAGLDVLAPLLVLLGVLLRRRGPSGPRRPWRASSEAVIRTCCSLPVARSLALTSRMPLASMSNVTSICGTPRGAGGIPSRMNRPSVLLSVAKSRSPWRTWISTWLWLSDAVEKTCDFDVGMVVLRSISRVMTPPSVSMPERQRRDVEEQDVLDVAGEHAGLDRGADRDDLVRVDALVRLLAAEHGS